MSNNINNLIAPRDSNIVNGHAWTERDEALFENLPKETQDEIVSWIFANLRSRKTPLLSSSSYGLKNMLERDTKIHITNNQFKDAMLYCGYMPSDKREVNWHFCISAKSPVFRNRNRRNQ